MALRVLLADESINIKKSIQVSLQDFGVEVRNVPVGVDVLPVSKDFKPDIILADVLLTKMNGYEVCTAIKNDPETRQIPVVLMWSVFMELDESKFKQCQADGRLEKPFDKESLRKLVMEFVPKTQTNELTGFLTLPEPTVDTDAFHKMPPDGPGSRPKLPSAPILNVDTGNSPDALSLGSDEKDEFEVRPIGRAPLSERIAEISPLSASSEDDEPWAQQQINQFQIGNESQSDASFEVEIPDIKVTEDDIQLAEPNTAILSKQKSSSLGSSLQMDEAVRAQIKESIEAAIWKILPDIAERVIREELEKLLKETERSL